MNNKNITFLLILLSCSLNIFAQTWTFDNMSLNGWTTHRLDHAFTASHIILTTKGQNNPRFDNTSAAVNATLNKYAVIKMKVGTGGPTLLRINFDGGFKSTPITTGSSNFITYTINMTDTDWSGTENDIELAFKDDDGSNGGATHNSDDINIEIEEISFVENIFAGSTALYIDLNNGNDNNIGSSALPFKTIPYALDIAAANDISNVYIKQGTYNLTSSIDISTSATTPIVLSPEPNESVTLNLGNYRNFRFYDGAKNIEVKGFELNGNSNSVDHWTLLSEYVWLPNNLSNALAGGGIAFNVEDSEDIKITENVIHDFYQKAVNIEDARYLKIEGNVIYNIGLTSLSGGHGIMRQQGSGSFTDNDDPSKYRWDIDGNLIFNVHQRIYSWVPSKGYLNMTLDEGKPILIDETPDHDTGMKARIINNIVAFSKIDAIRLKPTNNLEVSNNSIYTKDEHADGITNTTNGFDSSVYGEPFLNFECNNNAVEVIASKDAYSLDDAIASTGSAYANNYAAFGSVSPVAIASAQSSALFVNPDAGNFNLINSSLSNVGISSSSYTDLSNRVSSFNVNIANDNWEHDHLKNTQTLLDNVPGVEDGITGNEPVFLDPGTYDASDLEYDKGRKAYYYTINSVWQSNNINNTSVLNRRSELDDYDGMYEIIVPEEYSDWYDDLKANYLKDTNGDGIGDTPYTRIRYGASIIAQDKVFPDTSLHVVEIQSNSIYTVTEGDGVDITIDGDILIDFGYTPMGSETYDLIVANSINGSFDNIDMPEYSGTYTLEIVTDGSNQVLRLTLTSALPVELLYFEAQANANIVRLEWQTASEVNNDYFTIEKSKEGTNWREVIQVNGAGTSSKPINYHAIDDNPIIGQSYYRLKQTDLDGRIEYSSTEVVNINQEENEDLLLYPNPSTQNQEFIISSSNINLDKAKVMVYNSLGQKVRVNRNGNSFKPENRLSAGMYFITVQSISKTTVIEWKVN